MLTVAEMIRKSSRAAVLVEIGMKEALYMHRDPGTRMMGARIRPDRVRTLSDEAAKDLAECAVDPFVVQMETYLMTRALNQPKVFRPSAYQLRALEQMTINVPMRDFHMPFDTICVELPEDYAASKLVDNPHAGWRFGTHDQGDQHHPQISILHHDRTAGFFVHAAIFQGTSVKSWWAVESEDEEVEKWFDDSEFKTATELELTDAEHEAEAAVRRAVLNYCLLLDEVGTKVVGPACPNQYNQLVKWCRKNNKHTAKNRIALAGQPVVHAINREVQLIRTVVSEGDLPEQSASGRQMPPHHRRGHYRNQRHGVGLSLVKRIRILPCFVNSHLLMGGPPGATYTT